MFAFPIGQINIIAVEIKVYKTFNITIDIIGRKTISL